MARLDRFLVLMIRKFILGMSLRLSCQNHFQITSLFCWGGGGGGSTDRGLYLFDSKTCGSRLMTLKIGLMSGGGILFFRGTNSYVIVEKLKALKLKLKSWNKEVFGRVEDRTKIALQNLAHWDALGAQRSLTQLELERKTDEIEFKKWALLEEIMWRHKSREVWLKEGDRNTGFFHKMVNTHRRHNDIVSLKINGAWVNEGQDLKEGIVNASQVLLTDPENWRAKLEGLDFTKLDERETRSLDLPFTEEEIRTALYELNGEKAPSPDGFITAFWQFSWNTVKNEVMAVFKDFFTTGKFEKSLNSTFIVMIPKKGRSGRPKGF